MRSSTSSSNVRTRWQEPLVGGLLIALLLFFLLETAVRMLDFAPGVRDGADLWGLTRAQATKDNAIVLAGSSRIQLDIDTQWLAKLSGRPVVQLAIDGQSFQPVLRDLAEDTGFKGTLLIDALDQNLTAGLDEARAQAWVTHWQRRLRTEMSTRSEAWLSLLLQRHSAWYAAEQPWNAMLQHIAAGKRVATYLVTAPDRSRQADYGTRQQQANFYAARVLRNFGKPIDTSNLKTIADLEVNITTLLNKESPRLLPGFHENTENVSNLVQKIESRGGQIIFIRMPSSRLVKRIEDVRYPRHMYWDKFVEAAGINAIHFADEATLSTYQPPDGSHLDQRDTRQFTEALYQVLISRGLLSNTAAGSANSPTQ